jgi:hypothetical protein
MSLASLATFTPPGFQNWSKDFISQRAFLGMSIDPHRERNCCKDPETRNQSDKFTEVDANSADWDIERPENIVAVTKGKRGPSVGWTIECSATELADSQYPESVVLGTEVSKAGSWIINVLPRTRAVLHARTSPIPGSQERQPAETRQTWSEIS